MAEKKKNAPGSADKGKTIAASKAKNTDKKPAAEKKDKNAPEVSPAGASGSLPARLILGLVCLAMFICQAAVLVKPEGSLPLMYRNIMLGLFGEVGFYVLLAALPYLFWVLVCKPRCKVVMRCVSTILFVLTCGLTMQLLMPRHTYDKIWTAITELYAGGIEGTTAGLICGALGMGLQRICGQIVSFIVVLLLGTLLLLRAMEITVIGLYNAMQNRPRDPDLFEREEEEDPAAALVNGLANKRIERRRKRRDKQLDEDYEIYEEEEPLELPAPVIPAASGTNSTAAPKSSADGRKKNKFFDFDNQNPEPAPENPEPRTSEPPPKKKGEGAGPSDEKMDRMMRQVEEDIHTPVSSGNPQRSAQPEESDRDFSVIPKSMPEYTPDAPIPDAPKTAAREKKQGKTEKKPKSDEAQEVAAELENSRGAAKAPYCFPPINLLNPPSHASVNGTEEMKENSRRLNETLESFRIDARIINVTRGPSVTRYEVELDKGVRLNKLTSCADDIALSLGASGVRIAAVPGKISIVGIEVPNRIVTMVPLREVIDSDEFAKSKGKSSFAVGKDIGGTCIVGNIAKMPHMLIAGTTGSGKSVCMNSIIISLLYKASPEDVKLIMVDPKMVELANYNGIPHLMIPVVTDPKKAAGALQWAVTEMMRRYKTMSDAGVRDLESYNSIVLAEGGEKVPQLIVIIDELADLMMVAAKEVEDSICRIAQMGRASGVHLVIATQRPSSDVITGLMKANIPSRIAFSVASALESRIILDTQGAEKLVGKGDMLFAPIGSGKPLRVQGCFVTDEEVQAVAAYVKEHYVADYDQTVMADIEKKAQQTGKKPAASVSDPEPNSEELDGDELLPQAVDVMLETGQASVSMLQRRLKLGYARAARIVDEMEEKGYVGPFQGSKPRNILITKEKWEAMKASADSQMTFEDMDDPFVHKPEDF